jgi:spore photoproduct lyase
MEQQVVKQFAFDFWLSQSELKNLCDRAVDFSMWGEPSIATFLEYQPPGANKKPEKQKILKVIEKRWLELKNTPASYSPTSPKKAKKYQMVTESKANLGLGSCPVASEKTRCCNLITLDAVEGCGFDCSYCSIQTFYKGGSTATFDRDFQSKIDAIELEPNQLYHIGTGQSSDSLLWGNKNGMLDTLCSFAHNNPNLILEMKTKSDNIGYFLDKAVPKNILFTWSLNPQIIIDQEEHFSASLTRRLNAAKKLHDLGYLVGFHFHPMFYFQGWREAYLEIVEQLQKDFDPSRVALVSLGTLTFIKPVIKELRRRSMKSKVLQIPLTEADGKLSYPDDTKIEMFSFIYNNLKEWHHNVFFYMCMENHKLWQPVFGFEFASNNQMEEMMKMSYMRKITRCTQSI